MYLNFIANDDLLDVLDVVHDLTDWKRLGLALGLHYPTLTSIENYRRGMVDECMMDMLSAWLQQQDGVCQKGVPSWAGLKAALTRMGKNMIADRIHF